jgi:hypothetical protein
MRYRNIRALSSCTNLNSHSNECTRQFTQLPSRVFRMLATTEYATTSRYGTYLTYYIHPPGFPHMYLSIFTTSAELWEPDSSSTNRVPSGTTKSAYQLQRLMNLMTLLEPSLKMPPLRAVGPNRRCRLSGLRIQFKLYAIYTSIKGTCCP